MANIGPSTHVDDALLDFDSNLTEAYDVAIEQDGRVVLRFDDGELFKVDGWLADYSGTAE